MSFVIRCVLCDLLFGKEGSQRAHQKHDAFKKIPFSIEAWIFSKILLTGRGKIFLCC